MTGRRTYNRRYDRVEVPAGRTIRCLGTHQKLEGTVTILGEGGMFLRTRNYYAHGTILDLQIEDLTATIHARCAVRNVAPEGLGVEFLVISPSDFSQLQDLIIYMKSHGARHARP